MKTPIKIRLWTFVHDKAEHFWGYIWRKKLAPYHEQKWKEEMDRIGKNTSAYSFLRPPGQALTFNPWSSSRIGDTAGYDLYSSTLGSIETEKERMN